MAAPATRVSFADDFFDEIDGLDPADYKRVMTAVDDLRKNPDSPGLRLKALHGGLKGLMSIRAAQDLRVLVERRGNTFVILTGGSRQSVYDKAERGRLLVNPNTGYIGFVSPSSAKSVASVVVAEERPRPFDHWSNAELDELELASGVVGKLRALESEDGFFDLDLSEADQDVALEILELTHRNGAPVRTPVQQRSKSRPRRTKPAWSRP